MIRFALPLVLFVVLALFLARGLQLNPREVPSPLIDKPAPTFQLAQLHKENLSLATKDMLGKVWILNVWASWCVACLEEHPILLDYAKKKTVALIGLNYKDGRPEALRWLIRHGNPYDLSIVDADGRVGIDYGVYGVPETFVIDKQGVIRYKRIGPVTPDILKNDIVPLLGRLQG
jgi:cytochrome c biogenesis protein CcmG, thiol:disulfide interchange protein DsbE